MGGEAVIAYAQKYSEFYSTANAIRGILCHPEDSQIRQTDKAYGVLGELALCGDFFLVCQDFRIGIPGMLLQIIGGCLAINLLIRNNPKLAKI